MPNVLVDANYWIALINDNDQYNEKALNIHKNFNKFSLFIPWPILYETLGTKTVRSHQRVRILERLLSGKNIEYIDDSPYRKSALKKLYLNAWRQIKPVSMADMVISEIISDKRIKIGYLITFDEDAIRYEFELICRKRSIEIVSSK